MTQCMKISGIELKKQSAEPQCEGNSTQREYPLDVVYLPKQRGTTHQQVRGRGGSSSHSSRKQHSLFTFPHAYRLVHTHQAQWLIVEDICLIEVNY